MTTRHDIPGRGTGPTVSTYYVVNVATGEYMAVSTPEVVNDRAIRLVALEPGLPESLPLLLSLAVDAPAVAEVIEFARRPELWEQRPVTPDVAAALDAIRGGAA